MERKNTMMKKPIALICILLLIVTSIGSTMAAPNLKSQNNIEIINISTSEIHITGGNDEEFCGPSSFFVDGNKVYVLDSVSSEIKFYEDKKLSETLTIPGDNYFIDMDIDRDIIYLLNSNYKVVLYDLSKRSIIKSMEIPKVPELSFSVNTGKNTYTGDYRPKYIRYDDEIHIVFQNNKEYLFDGTNLTPYKKLKLQLKNEKAEFDVNSEKIQLETMGQPVSVRYLSTDQSGNDYIKIDSMYQDDNGKQYVEECIHQYKNNAKASSVTLEDNGFFTPNRNVFVAKSGQIYQMVISDKGLSVIKLQKQNQYKQKYKLQKWEEHQEYPANKSISTSADTVSTLATSWPLVKKSQLEAVVESYMSLSWTYNKSTNGNINRVSQSYRQYVTQPHTLSGYTDTSNHTIYNMPYCWGGYDSPSDFKTKVNGTTYYAGNVSSSYGSYVPNTAGIDCSGFVCRAFLISDKLGTSTMSSSGAFVRDTGSADTYDVWIKSGSHTMLNYGRVYDEGINGYYVYESTTKDNVDRCFMNFEDPTYVSGFTLYKYANFDPNN